jgi:hypothetical protein
MNKPTMVFIAGVGCLLVLGLAVKYFVSSDSEERAAAMGDHIAAAVADRAAGSGWAGASGGTSGQGAGKGSGPRAAGGGRATAERGGKGGSETRGQADVRFADRRGNAGADVGGATGATGGSISVRSGAPLPSSDNALALKNRRESAAKREIVAQDWPPDDHDGTAADEEGLVLSLPFKEGTQAEAGQDAAVEEGVAFASDEGAYFATDAQFVVPNAGNLKGEAGTISFRMDPDWGGDDGGDASLVQLRGGTWENRLQIFKNGQFFRFLFTPDSGLETGVGIDISKWPANEPKYITTTWGETPTGERVVSMYVNGALVGQAPYQGQLQINPGWDLRIGSDHPGAMAGARAVISDFKAYDRQLESDRIATLPRR